jgi:GNAT superfamily N-acetyltransferase
MSVVANELATVNAEVARRLWAIDSLLPAPGASPPGCGACFTAEGPNGLAGFGTCLHWEGEPGSLEPTWGAERRFMLDARIAGPDVRTTLDELLSQWHRHLADVPETKGDDTAAVVTWPSRDVAGITALVRHKFNPFGVAAARLTARPDGATDKPGPTPRDDGLGGRPAEAGVRIRRAAPDDIDAAVSLGLEVVRFDAHFGNVTERPSTAGALRREISDMLAGPQPWVWLAERDGNPVGMLAAQRPEAAGWIAPMVRLAPAGYLMLMAVHDAERGNGVGAAMVARFHDEIARAGIPVTLVHHEQVNPLGGPFWAKQGYRPLWTSWEARPAWTFT